MWFLTFRSCLIVSGGDFSVSESPGGLSEGHYDKRDISIPEPKIEEDGDIVVLFAIKVLQQGKIMIFTTYATIRKEKRRKTLPNPSPNRKHMCRYYFCASAPTVTQF